ncbi:MAG: hypothetical protein HFE73_05165 [Firmicutes bacterium]|nr:hypothetical protein [Bacillota bacterium]
MILALKSIRQDAYGKAEYPPLFLKTLANEPICPINCYGFEAEFRYNDISEIRFTVASMIEEDGQLVPNPCFDEIKGMRLIDMGPYGMFVLINPQKTSDGPREIKNCTAYSDEYRLNYVQAPVFDDETLMLYNPVPLGETDAGSNDLMHMVLEKCPDWSIAYVAPTLSSRYRTFSSANESVYSFLMNTVQESYNCIITFDSRKKEIYIHDAAMAAPQSDVFLDKANLVTSLDIEEKSDEIVTVLSVYGDSDTSIQPVNVLASDKIYNLDYFIGVGDIPKDLGLKWKSWSHQCRIYQKIFSDLYSKFYHDQSIYQTNLTKKSVLEGELTTLKDELDAHIIDALNDGDVDKTSVYEDLEEIKQQIEAEITAKEGEITAMESQLEALKSNVDTDLSSMKEITRLCAFQNYFTPEELAVLRQFFKEDSISDSTYAIPNLSDRPLAAKKITADSPISVSIDYANLYEASEYSDLTTEEWSALDIPPDQKAELRQITDNLHTSYLGQKFYRIHSGRCAVNGGKDFDLKGSLVSSSLSHSKTPNSDGSYDGMVSFTINEPVVNGDAISYTNALLVASCKIQGLSCVTSPDPGSADSMTFEMVDGILTLTADSSIQQRMYLLQDLYDYGVTCLENLAYPAYEFRMDASNFLFAPEYRQFHDTFALGHTAYLEYAQDFYLRPIMTGIKIQYDNWPSLELVFSNRYRSNDPDFKLADTIGKAAKTAASLDASKFRYTDFQYSGVKNDVEELMSGVLDVAKKSIINSAGQDVLIDAQGIHLRKYDQTSGSFDPGEIRLINNQIVFTNDGWDTASLAIGKLKTPDNSSTMGIVGQSIIGEILIGNKLVIEATGKDDFTGDTVVRHFRVDSKGASLANASLAIQGTDGGQILLDPNYGILAGSGGLFTLGESGYTPNFIGEGGKIICDEEAEAYNVILPKNSSFYFDIASGSLAFRGDVYAKNGYFGGHVKATSLDCTNATVTGLVVGNNVHMGPNAVISWDNLPGSVASISDITRITQNNITTGDLLISGYLYDLGLSTEERKKYYDKQNSKKQIILGINTYNNLQVGSPNGIYGSTNIYAKENIYMLPGGESLGDGKDSDDPNYYNTGWVVCVRGTNSAKYGRGVAIHGKLTVNGSNVLTDAALKNVTAKFG